MGVVTPAGMSLVAPGNASMARVTPNQTNTQNTCLALPCTSYSGTVTGQGITNQQMLPAYSKSPLTTTCNIQQPIHTDNTQYTYPHHPTNHSHSHTSTQLVLSPQTQQGFQNIHKLDKS